MLKELQAIARDNGLTVLKQYETVETRNLHVEQFSLGREFRSNGLRMAKPLTPWTNTEEELLRVAKKEPWIVSGTM